MVAEEVVDEEWLSEIARWLVDSGCLYLVAWGIDCEKWHDSVDWANLEDFNYGDIPDDRLVMTSWHTQQPVSEAYWFAGHCADHPDVDLHGTLIVHVATKSDGQAVLKTYAEAQATE